MFLQAPRRHVMKKIYLIQANNVYGKSEKSTYIPYATGCIQAYCQRNPSIAANYCFERIIYKREPIEKLLQLLDDPFIVMFSCSVWNMEYNKVAAAAIKAKYPACRIVFGGHSVSSDGENLQRFPFVDFLTHRFGEEPSEGILIALAEGRLPENVPNVSFRRPDGTVVTTDFAPQLGTDYPSPYLDGVFDEILKDDIQFSALFETNRGCPNACSFCDWSSLRSKVRLFPMERVLAEIDWFVQHKFEFIYCTDGNFCLINRDAEIAEYIVMCKQTYGYPKVFRVCFTKNRLDFVFQIGSLFVKNGLDKTQTVSFQSLNPEVLRNVGRKNIPSERFRDLMKNYQEQNIPTLSELILGLPGETYDSFCEGIKLLLEGGQHFAINVYPCELLPNSEMGQTWYKEKYQIKSKRVPFKLIHSFASQKQDAITEYSEYIVATYSMNEHEWARAMLFADYVQGLHNLGLLRNIAIYCCKEFGVTYDVFYNGLIEWSKQNTSGLLHRVYQRVFTLCKGIINGNNELVATCEGFSDLLWGFDEIVFLEFYKQLDVFYDEIRQYVASICFSDERVDKLFQYQHDIIKKINMTETAIVSDYDFYHYFQDVFLNKTPKLQKQRTILKIVDRQPVVSLTDFAIKTVWYGRNRRETDYSSNHYDVSVLTPSLK